MRRFTLATWAGLVWVLALLLILSAGKAEPLEPCPDGHARPIGTCYER